LELNVKNLELNNLPTGIKKIRFHRDCKYNGELNCLPKSINHIQLNKCYNKKITNIPKELIKIECAKNYQFINDFINNYEVSTYDY
jgi:hypothetical protein